jgi:F0F1-type ATP synthase membrane subunit b/b'
MSTIIIPFIHVAILFAFIYKKTKGSVVNGVRERSQTIADKINESKRVVAEMQKRRSEIEARANNIPALKEKILSEWKAREQEQIQKIQAGSLRVRDQLLADGKRNLTALQAGFGREVRAVALLQLLTATEKKVASGLNASTTSAIEKKFVTEIAAAESARG